MENNVNSSKYFRLMSITDESCTRLLDWKWSTSTETPRQLDDDVYEWTRTSDKRFVAPK
jgi:hypothetical protein